MSGKGRTASWSTRNCYGGASERTGDMTGKMKSGSPAISGHRPWAAVSPVGSTEGVRRRLDMETGRLLLDDGDMPLQHAIAGKTQRGRRIGDWAAAGRDSVSRMRQGDRGRGSHRGSLMSAGELLHAEVEHLPSEGCYLRLLRRMEGKRREGNGFGRLVIPPHRRFSNIIPNGAGVCWVTSGTCLIFSSTAKAVMATTASRHRAEYTARQHKKGVSRALLSKSEA